MESSIYYNSSCWRFFSFMIFLVCATINIGMSISCDELQDHSESRNFNSTDSDYQNESSECELALIISALTYGMLVSLAFRFIHIWSNEKRNGMFFVVSTAYVTNIVGFLWIWSSADWHLFFGAIISIVALSNDYFLLYVIANDETDFLLVNQRSS